MKQRTQIAKEKEKYASNRVYIQKVANLTDDEYNELVFETGCEFLDAIYPTHSKARKYYTIVSKDPNYWDWWRAEWKKFEQTILNSTEVLDVVKYYKCLEVMNSTSFINHSYYHNYTKKANHAI